MSLTVEKENLAPIENEKERRRSRHLSESLSAGPSIDDFIILKAISRGAFGKVYLGCKKTQPDKIFAIKAMKKDDMVQKNMIQQVIAERDALAISKSPFIVRLFYSLQSREQIFLVMEYMIGGDVKSLLSVCGCFEESMAVTYTAEVILALEYLHSHHIIHRDLKPDNMLISPTGHIKLTDFGLSKVTLNRQLSISDVVSTPSVAGRPSDNYFRTPGQVLSLTANFSFGNNKITARPPYFSEYRKVNHGSRLSNYSTPDVKRVRCVTPQSGLTPRPVQSLTPTLQESLEWGQSSASEPSSIAILARRSRLSSCAGVPARATDNSAVPQDEVFGDDESKGALNDESRRNNVEEDAFLLGNSSNFKIPTGKSLQRRQGMHTGEHYMRAPGSNASFTCTPINRQNQSVLTDDDTPHLYRTKEAIQKSYAARHLASMREGSDSPDGSNLDSPDNGNGSMTSWLNKVKDESICSIEMKRDRESPPPFDLCITNPKMCLTMSPEYSDSFTHRKRRYDCVEKSPISLRSSCNNSTGLTSEFQRFQVHSNPPAKRCNIELNASPVRSMLSFQDSIVPKTPDHPDNYSIIEPSTLESPCTPLKLIPQAALIHISSSPVLANPCKSPQSSSDVTGSAEAHANTSSLSLDNSLNVNKDDYLDISGTHAITPSSPVDDAESSLGSELNNMSSVFFPLKGNLPHAADDQLSNLAMSFSNSAHDSSQNNASVMEEDNFLNQDACDDSSSNAGQSVDQSAVENQADTVESNDQEMGNRHSSFSPDKSHEEPLACKSPATSTPQLNDHAKDDFSEGNCKFPVKKPVNKLIKKVAHFSSMPSSISSGCHSSDSDPSWVTQTPRNNWKSKFNAHATPYRTPKSVRRGRPQAKEERILGTPDYLAPELLLQQGHDAAVDWWALGVCLFEFLTGVPPFNDETPEAVFQNILNRDIPWPEGEEELSEQAQLCIDMLLSMDSQKRPGAEELKQYELFSEIDWKHVHEADMPFVPCPDNSTDTSYFDARNNLQHLEMSSIDI